MIKLKHVSRETYEKLIFDVIPPLQRVNVLSFLDTKSGLFDVAIDTRDVIVHVEYSSITGLIRIVFNGLNSVSFSTDDVEMEVT